MKSFLLFCCIALVSSSAHATSLHCDLALSIQDGQSSEQKRLVFDTDFHEEKNNTVGQMITTTCYDTKIFQDFKSSTATYSAEQRGDFIYAKYADTNVQADTLKFHFHLNLTYSAKDPDQQNPIYFSAEGEIAAVDDPIFIYNRLRGQCILDQR